MSIFGGAALAGLATGEVLNKIFDYSEKALSAHDKYSAASGHTSLAKITAVSRVEPLCIVDSDCIHLDYISDVLMSLQSIFSGYYLQAVSLIGTVSGVQVARELDRLNPNRDVKVSDFLKATRDTVVPYRLDQQSYQWALPTKKTQVSMEATVEVDEETRLAELAGKERGVVSDKEFVSTNEMANLSVGRLINVTISKNGQSMSVPISFRLMVNELRPSTLIKIFGNGSLERSFKERYYKWKAGRISFFNDLILCRDLIKEHRKALIEDKEGVFSEIQRRAKSNTLAGLATKNPSMATASNLYVISEETARAIKRTSGMDVTNFNQRQKLFESTYAMVLVVVDREYQRVSFYHDGIQLPTSVGVRDIRNSNKGAGPSIMDILAAYKQGQAPTL